MGGGAVEYASPGHAGVPYTLTKRCCCLLRFKEVKTEGPSWGLVPASLHFLASPAGPGLWPLSPSRAHLPLFWACLWNSHSSLHWNRHCTSYRGTTRKDVGLCGLVPRGVFTWGPALLSIAPLHSGAEVHQSRPCTDLVHTQRPLTSCAAFYRQRALRTSFSLQCGAG